MSDIENQHEEESELKDELEQEQSDGSANESDEFDVSSLLASSQEDDESEVGEKDTLVNEELSEDETTDPEALSLTDEDSGFEEEEIHQAHSDHDGDELTEDDQVELSGDSEESDGSKLELSDDPDQDEELSAKDEESNFDPISGEFQSDEQGSEDDAWMAAPNDSGLVPTDIGDDGSFGMPEEIKLDAQVEAIIFASEKSIKVADIVEIIADEDVGSQEVLDVIKSLQQFYEERGGGFRLEHVRGGGYQFRTVAAAGPFMERMFASRPRPISRAAQETLAIVAYRQPVTRADVEFIRGVDAGSIMKNLLERDMIKCVGRKEDAGRPMLFGTTDEFLRVYQLTSLKDLPPLDSFQPSPETMKDAKDVMEGDKEVDVEDFIKDADKEEQSLSDEDTQMQLSAQEQDEEFIEDNEGPLTQTEFMKAEDKGSSKDQESVDMATESEEDDLEDSDEHDEAVDDGSECLQTQMEGEALEEEEISLAGESEEESIEQPVSSLEGAVSAQPTFNEQVDQSLVEEDNQIEGASDGTDSVTEMDIPAGDRISEGSGKMDS